MTPTLPHAPRAATRLAALPLAVMVLAACAPVSDRVILLPTPQGRPSGQLLVSANGGELLLDQPYAQAEVAGAAPRPGQADPAEVARRHTLLLAQQPARSRQFTVRFDTNSDRLNADSQPTIEAMKRELAAMTGVEVVVIGHTDRVGSLEANDRLSLARAQAVREILVAAGVPRELISVAGRGERETLVDTADEVPEPRNRRVEIKLR